MNAEELARKHWREEGEFHNPFPANTEEFRQYETVAWQILMDDEWGSEAGSISKEVWDRIEPPKRKDYIYPEGTISRKVQDQTHEEWWADYDAKDAELKRKGQRGKQQ